jgi:hypothetical protein
VLRKCLNLLFATPHESAFLLVARKHSELYRVPEYIKKRPFLMRDLAVVSYELPG